MYQEEKAYIGNLSQLFDVKTYRFTGGRREGVEAVDVSTGGGLEFTVTPGRCMDFYQLKFRGKNLNFITPNGITAAPFCETDKNLFLRSFAGGFLTTCGLTTIGEGGEDGGEMLPLHGRIHAAPAEIFSADVSVVDSVPQALIKGTMREAVLFGDCLTLTRVITCRYGENKLSFIDTVENIGYRSTPHMILYHFNMGYPLLSDKAKLIIPTNGIQPCNAHAAVTQTRWNQLEAPQPGMEESCFYHDLHADADGFAAVGVDNPAEHIGVRIRFDRKALPYFVQWRMLGSGEYVTGLEPANATIDGRAQARAEGKLPFLQPGEKITYHFEIEAFDL